MNKEQQIEELAKLVQAKEVYPCGDDEHCEDCYCVFKEIAEMIYKAGYRNTFTSDIASVTQKAYKEGYEKARKETAKEILNDLYFNLQISVKGNIWKSNDYYNVMGWIEEIAKEYGVEVEE